MEDRFQQQCPLCRGSGKTKIVRGDLWEQDVRCLVKSGVTQGAAEVKADKIAIQRAPKLRPLEAAAERASAVEKAQTTDAVLPGNA